MDDDYRVEPEGQQSFPLPGAGRRPVVTWSLVAANVVMWLATTVAVGSDETEVLIEFGALFGPLIAEGQYWRLFTATFLHVGFLHLAFNGFALFIFGPLVERAYGHIMFLAIYVLSGLAGSVTSYVFNSISIGVGASGAVFGVLGALAAFFLVHRRTFGSIAQRNLTGLLFLAGANLFYGLLTPGIDNWAHMGGFAAGFGLGVALSPRYRLVTTGFVGPTVLLDASPAVKRWWVAPAAAALLLAGVWLGSATLPDNAYSHVYQAERHFEQGSYDAALDEIERAFRLAPTMDRQTQARAVRLLVALRSRR